MSDADVAIAARRPSREAWRRTRPIGPQASAWLTGALAVGAAAIDALLVLDSFAAPVALRALLREGPGAAPLEAEIWSAVAVALLTVACLAALGAYELDRRDALWSTHLFGILASLSIALVTTMSVAGLAGVALDPLWPLAAVVAGPVLAGWHAWNVRGHLPFSAALIRAPRALVVGAGPAGDDAVAALEAQGHRVLGFVDDRAVARDGVAREVLGSLARLDELVRRLGVDEILIALPPQRREGLRSLLIRGFGRDVRVSFAPELAELLPRHFTVRRIGGRHYVEFGLSGRVAMMKRVMDLTLGTAALVVLAPVLLAAAVAIRIDTPGPVLYSQVRLGRDRRPFRMLKFRSMVDGADGLAAALASRNEVSGPMFKIRQDPRVTRVGRVLRRFSVDELPQLLNVISGDMSLVGPRPPLPGEVERYEDWQLGRLRVLPGCTGLWQVSGRTDLPFEDMVSLDLAYVRGWSLWLDLSILLRTIPALLGARGAY